MQYTSSLKMYLSFDLAHISMQKYVFKDFHSNTACISKNQNQKARKKSLPISSKESTGSLTWAEIV